MTAIGAMILALSKYQHLVLPIVLGIAVWVGAGRAGRRVALVLLVAGTIGAGAQIVNGLQWTEMARDIAAWINRADYALDVLLAETSDRDRVVGALAINDECLDYIGKSGVYVMPGRVDQTCKTVDAWRNGTLWWLLVSDPPALGRALLHIPRDLLPWQPRYLGAVEGGNNEHQPWWMPSLDLLFGDRIAFAWALLLAPWLIATACLKRGTPPIARAFALACATGMVAVLVVALFGDGDVEFAKHAHLAVSFALASLCLPVAALCRRLLVHDALAGASRMSGGITKRPFVVALLILLWTAGIGCAHCSLCMHRGAAVPGVRANSYDETRYTSCFHFYPDRPADVPPGAQQPRGAVCAVPFHRAAAIRCATGRRSSRSPLVWTTLMPWKSAEALGGAARSTMSCGVSP